MWYHHKNNYYYNPVDKITKFEKALDEVAYNQNYEVFFKKAKKLNKYLTYLNPCVEQIEQDIHILIFHDSFNNIKYLHFKNNKEYLFVLWIKLSNSNYSKYINKFENIDDINYLLHTQKKIFQLEWFCFEIKNYDISIWNKHTEHFNLYVYDLKYIWHSSTPLMNNKYLETSISRIKYQVDNNDTMFVYWHNIPVNYPKEIGIIYKQNGGKINNVYFFWFLWNWDLIHQKINTDFEPIDKDNFLNVYNEQNENTAQYTHFSYWKQFYLFKNHILINQHKWFQIKNQHSNPNLIDNNFNKKWIHFLFNETFQLTKNANKYLWSSYFTLNPDVFLQTNNIWIYDIFYKPQSQIDEFFSSNYLNQQKWYVDLKQQKIIYNLQNDFWDLRSTTLKWLETNNTGFNQGERKWYITKIIHKNCFNAHIMFFQAVGDYIYEDIETDIKYIRNHFFNKTYIYEGQKQERDNNRVFLKIKSHINSSMEYDNEPIAPKNMDCLYPSHDNNFKNDTFKQDFYQQYYDCRQKNKVNILFNRYHYIFNINSFISPYMHWVVLWYNHRHAYINNTISNVLHIANFINSFQPIDNNFYLRYGYIHNQKWKVWILIDSLNYKVRKS